MYTATDRMRFAWAWPITYWSRIAEISLGRRQAGLAAFDILIAGDFVADDVVAQIDAFITDKTDGPAMSFFTSCWLLPQKSSTAAYRWFSCPSSFSLVVLQAASVRLLRTLSIRP